MRDDLYAKCLAFVDEQSRGEWGDTMVAEDAKKLEEFVLARLAERDEWRPIETAPTNTSVLVWIDNAEHYGPGVYRGLQVDLGTGRRWMTSAMHMGRDCPSHAQPTKWRPLPAAPLQAREMEA